jgi:hypothetical protein
MVLLNDIYWQYDEDIHKRKYEVEEKNEEK